MKRRGTRAVGLIAVVLGIALILLGIFASVSGREGTPLYRPAQNALEEAQRLADARAALTAVPEAIDRADRRAQEAAAASQAAIEAAQDAQVVEDEGGYDPETDVGALGQAILEAGSSGAQVEGILDAYSPVFNAGLLAQLDEVKTSVKRAESAAEDAAEALTNAADAAKALDAGAVFDEIPALSEAEVAKLGEHKGADRLRMRGENYLLRSQTAAANASALRAAADAILPQAQAVIDAHPVSFGSKVLSFIRARWLDLVVYGALIALAGLLAAVKPTWFAARWKNALFRKAFFFVVVVALLAVALHYADGDLWALMRQGVFDTLYMAIPATFFAYVLGLPLGVLLVITRPGHIRPNPTLNSVLGTVVNFLRSIPFIILLVMLFDVTRFVMGSAIGTRAIIFPLFVSAFPYVARIVESSLNEVDGGVIEAAQSMGSTTWQIIHKVLIPEALPSLINGAAICMTTILAYTAMAGSAGGDGLGKIAITYGLNYRDYPVMYISSLLLVALVQIIQIAGGILTRACDHRRK